MHNEFRAKQAAIVTAIYIGDRVLSAVIGKPNNVDADFPCYLNPLFKSKEFSQIERSSEWILK
ncbi:hypothetical protein [Chroococcidiopsis sp. SAG 2025]|uniref:hypothetical protein n=1 Tax=Chroococcidiopsis sp. SAG 2025 TaxID=171389 RepID=UPI002936F77E|nr:hypothetical protein [Chroococcidiopsis sp. SAG 2025]